MRVRAAVFVLFVAVSAFGMAVPAGAGVGGALATGGADEADAGTADASAGGGPTNNTTMGDQMSSFMESSAGGTDASVDSEVWADDGGSNESLERRAARIEDRLERLQERKAELKAEYQNGTISEQAYRAQLSNVVGQLAALNRSIEDLASQGADAETIQRLRDDAQNLSGGDVSGIARSMAGGPPSGLPDRAANESRGGGQGGDRTGGEGNGGGQSGDGKGSDGTGGQGNASDGAGNGGNSSDGSQGGNGQGNGGDGGQSGGSGDGAPGDDSISVFDVRRPA